MEWDHFGTGMGFGGVFMILFWIVILVLVVLLLKAAIGSSTRANVPPEKTALDILKERYARGEIGKDEFEQKRRDLE